MNLQGVVAVSGKPGLWKALAQNKTGYILESFDAQRTKLVANLSTAKLAALHEITLFGNDDDIKLTDVFEQMKHAGEVPDTRADGKTLRAYFRRVAPNHDEEKVYASDMKKVIGWYHILKDMPFFSEAKPETPVEENVVENEVPVPDAAAVAEPVSEPAKKADTKPRGEQQKSPVKNKE